MGLLLHDADIPQMAARLGIEASEFRRQLRALKTMVRMDVMEHRDGAWEIVYGPCYINHSKKAVPATDDGQIGGIQAFTMPGWENYSTWGLEEVLGRRDQGCFYAQLYLNTDDPDAEPRIWITPPHYVLSTMDELAAAITDQVSRHMGIDFPAEVIKTWLKR